jgi:predicted esterase YcpF (UPF0227 family)
MTMPTHLLYLHGFRSSPQSTKAQLLVSLLERHFPQVHRWCPQLPPSPRAAAQLIEARTRDWPRDTMAVVGSSLGGFYATWLAQLRSCKAVLINPAVHPARDLARHIGEQTAWHNSAERFYFEPYFVDELRALEVGPLSRPDHLMAVIATGDEVLDWHEMQARYVGCRLRIVEGSDHALSDFEKHLPAILQFLGFDPPPLH